MEQPINTESFWEEVKEKIKETNPDITDADLNHDPGREDEMYVKLSQKLHKSFQEVKDWIESIASNKSIAG
jgi:hypothetical protein